MALVDQYMSNRVRAQSGKSVETDEVDDFGLYYPLWYAYDTWIEHEDHGRYPDAGGYNDQDWMLMQDWKTLDQRYGKAVRESGSRDPLEAFSGQNVPNAKNWSEL